MKTTIVLALRFARLGVVFPVALVALWSSMAFAADPDPGALGEALFRSGRELMADGKYSEACPKFAESNRIDPKLGTLMNLALCHENVGKTASAWAEYLQAADIAKRVGQAPREQVARERAHDLEAKLPHVIIDASAEPSAVVTLDDQPIGSGAFGTPMPLDPGDHVVRATAPGKKPYVESLTAPNGATEQTVRIPALEAKEPEPPPLEAPAPPNPSPSTQRTWAWVVGGAGVAMIGTGAFFGVSAFSDKKTVESQCNSDTSRCTPTGSNAKTSLSTAETVSTIAALGGVAAIGVGAYLWLSGGPHSSPSAQPATGLRVEPDFAARGLRMELIW